MKLWKVHPTSGVLIKSGRINLKDVFLFCPIPTCNVIMHWLQTLHTLVIHAEISQERNILQEYMLLLPLLPQFYQPRHSWLIQNERLVISIKQPTYSSITCKIDRTVPPLSSILLEPKQNAAPEKNTFVQALILVLSSWCSLLPFFSKISRSLTEAMDIPSDDLAFPPMNSRQVLPKVAAFTAERAIFASFFNLSCCLWSTYRHQCPTSIERLATAQLNAINSRKYLIL